MSEVKHERIRTKVIRTGYAHTRYEGECDAWVKDGKFGAVKHTD